MKIVLEETIIIGLFLNFLILKTTSFMTCKARLKFLSSLVGVVISLVAPLYKLHAVLKIVVLVFTSIIMVLISFKYNGFKNFVLILSIFFLSTFLYGGACFAVNELVGSFPLFVVALIGIATYALYSCAYRIVSHRNRMKNFVYKLKIRDGEKMIEEEGYLDSGNVLYDTITKSPIVLVNFDVFSKLYKDIPYLALITKKINSSSIKNGHYIKINSIGRGTSLLVFTVDEMNVEDKCYKNVSLGLSFSGFERSLGTNILLHCDYA